MTSDDSTPTDTAGAPVTADRRRYPAWVIWGAGLVGGAGVLAVQFWPVRGAVEDNLTDRSTEALDAAGFDMVEVRFSGRDGLVSAESLAPDDASRVEAIVGELEGVRVVRLGEIDADDSAEAADADDEAETAAPEPTETPGTAEPSEAVGPGPAEPTGTPSADGIEQTDEAAASAASTDAGDETADDDTADDDTGDDAADADAAEDDTAGDEAAEDDAAGDRGDGSSDGSVGDPGESGSVPDVQESLDVLSTITFASDRFGLRPEASPVLDLAAEIMLSGPPDQQYEVRAHTDTSGRAAYNEWLSRARASSVRDALVERGVPADRLRTVGLGESEPLVDPETSDAEREQNRRIELVAVD